MFTDASGNRELGWALTGPLANEDGELVIWVCDDHEWDVSEREFRDPKGVAVASASVVILAARADCSGRCADG